MQLFYNLGIKLYSYAILFVSLWNKKAKLFVRGRKEWRNELQQKRNIKKSLFWFHCSSLGEYEQAIPIIEVVKEQFPEHEIGVSFFSPSGYEIRKNHPLPNFTFYLPVDSKKNAKDLVKILNPDILILVKYEYWFNLIAEMKRQQKPVIVVSAILHPHQIFFKPFLGKWFRKGLQNISYFFVQNRETKELLNNISVSKVEISGDTRFDRVKKSLKENDSIKYLQEFKSYKPLMVAGSTWQEDEEFLIHYFHKKNPEVKLIIAPHNLKEHSIEKLNFKLKKSTVRYTQINNKTNLKDSDILILDTMGMLTKVYSYANYAYVGGGFTKSGVHNTLEPAVYGLPIVIGKNFKKFQEVKDLVRLGGIKTYSSQPELNQILDKIFWQPMEAQKIGNITKNFVLQQPNATIVILNYLKKIIS